MEQQINEPTYTLKEIRWAIEQAQKELGLIPQRENSTDYEAQK